MPSSAMHALPETTPEYRTAPYRRQCSAQFVTVRIRQSKRRARLTGRRQSVALHCLTNGGVVQSEFVSANGDSPPIAFCAFNSSPLVVACAQKHSLDHHGTSASACEAKRASIRAAGSCGSCHEAARHTGRLVRTIQVQDTWATCEPRISTTASSRATSRFSLM